jgi:hypothetical protein
MARRRGQGRGRARGGRTRPLGLVLAIFALLCQSLVLLLPLPAMAMPASSLPADAALFSGGYVLCQDDDGTAPASDTDKAPCQHCVDCPVCQVFHADAGGLVPPTLPALPVPTVAAIRFVPAATGAHAPRLLARAHQPRAPPVVSSL